VRKVSLLLVLGISLSLTPNAQAATNPKAVTAAFTKVLSATDNSLEALELKYESDIDALDAALASSTIAASETYDSEMKAATSLYSPQISASNKKTLDAQAKFPSVSGVRVLALGTNRNYWGNISCPVNRPICKDPGDAGEKFIVGEVTNIKPILSASSLDYLPEIDIMVSLGLIELLQASELSSVIAVLRNEPLNLKRITLAFSSAQAAAQSKKNRAIDEATQKRLLLLQQIEETYASEKENLEAQNTIADLALLATKRASKDPATFDSAFVVAYKFEYNRQMVNEIADAVWTGDWTYRTIDSIIKVNRLAVTGDSIASRYTKSAASSFNSAVGNAFTNEPDFRAALKVLTSIYKKTTNTTLKF
jgi:hypothetical protein